MPILNNVSYLIYIIVAACGGLLLERQVPNLSLSGLPFSLAVMVPFLGMSRQFATNIQMISPQINALSTCMMLVTVSLVVISQLLQKKGYHSSRKD